MQGRPLKWVGKRDIVLIDEYPDPVDTDTVRPYLFFTARDEEDEQAPFALAAKWADEQTADSIEPVDMPFWVDKVLATDPSTEPGRRIRLLATRIRAGTAFQRSDGKSLLWTGYDYDMPFTDKAIVFSATASMEGWHFHPSTPSISKDGPKVSYRNLTARHIPWPSGVDKYHKKIVADPKQIRLLQDHLRGTVFSAGPETLFISPKSLTLHIQSTFPEAQHTYWGVDIGSNEYRECTRVVLVSEFHAPRDALLGKYLGHAGLEATDDKLSAGDNYQSATNRQLRELHYRMYLKQMIARGSCREVDSDGVAAPMEVFCMIDPKRFNSTLSVLFPDCQLEGIEDNWFMSKKDRQNSPVSRQVIQYLSQLPDDVSRLTAPELKEAGINIGRSDRKKQLLAANDDFAQIGWSFVPGSQGRGNCARMVRL